MDLDTDLGRALPAGAQVTAAVKLSVGLGTGWGETHVVVEDDGFVLYTRSSLLAPLVRVPLAGPPLLEARGWDAVLRVQTADGPRELAVATFARRDLERLLAAFGPHLHASGHRDDGLVGLQAGAAPSASPVPADRFDVLVARVQLLGVLERRAGSLGRARPRFLAVLDARAQKLRREGATRPRWERAPEDLRPVCPAPSVIPHGGLHAALPRDASPAPAAADPSPARRTVAVLVVAVLVLLLALAVVFLAGR